MVKRKSEIYLRRKGNHPILLWNGQFQRRMGWLPFLLIRISLFLFTIGHCRWIQVCSKQKLIEYPTPRHWFMEFMWIMSAALQLHCLHLRLLILLRLQNGSGWPIFLLLEWKEEKEGRFFARHKSEIWQGLWPQQARARYIRYHLHSKQACVTRNVQSLTKTNNLIGLIS